MNNTYAIINGSYVAEQEARILISDLSIQRGYGIFDYFRTVQRRPVFLDDHLDRFYRSAAFMNLPVETGRGQLKELIMGLIEKNDLADSGIRMTLTGGYSPDGYTPAKPNLLITQAPFVFDKSAFSRGISLVTHDYQRQLPQVKTIDYLQAIYLQPFIREQQADDVLYHQQSSLRECPRANFFAVMENDEVLTPANNILKGVTRKKILAFSDLNVKEADIQLQDLQHIKEAFITSSTKEVLPVVKIDGRTVGNGQPGKVTAAIYERLLSVREQYFAAVL